MTDLRNFNDKEMLSLIERYNEPMFRSKQLFDWVHNKEVESLSDCRNMSKKLILQLQQDGYKIEALEIANRQISKDGTEKYLFRLADDEYIESVLMKYRGDYSKQRNTLCVSSQVGCAMGCSFCATGSLGMVRNLSVSEIIGQVYAINRILKVENSKMSVRNIVFMGMGEPLANFDSVIKAIDILTNPKGADMARRRLTISTCGLVPGIIRLADMKTDIGLAISLHASNQEVRQNLMPIAKRYPLDELIEACRYYCNKTGRRISFEYTLIKGLNDGLKEVKELASLLKDIDGHINIIPLNPVSHVNYSRPDNKSCRLFQEKLRKYGIGASIRETKGDDIDGACGQLRAKELDSV